MAKKGKKRSRTQALFEAARKRATTFQEEGEEEDRQQLTDQNLAITIRTLQSLSSQPDEIHSKRYKELRKALHPLVLEQLKNYDKGVDYKAKVTLHLSNQQWSQALAALQGCKDFQQLPKQGTIQRWVRDVDGCHEGPVKIQLLTSILSLGDDAAKDNDDEDQNQTNLNNKHDPRLALLEAQKNANFQKSAADSSLPSNKGLKILENWKVPVENDSDSDNMTDLKEKNLASISKIIYQEEASTRKPPNHYDLLLHATLEPGVITFCPKRTTDNVVKHEVPFVKGGFLLQNVLTNHECAQLRQAATQLGYRPDHPTSLEHPTGIDSCEWLIDNSIHSVIYERVKRHLPPTMGNNDSQRVHGINRRWRFFRYGQNCVYRPHLDGSWPESRINEDQEYECDTSGKRRSFLTFLIYLNDNFQGGETRYYYAAPVKGMEARGVTPKIGSIMIFPQGNSASILHEGSAVTRGSKYVIRTDVLYSSNIST